MSALFDLLNKKSIEQPAATEPDLSLKEQIAARRARKHQALLAEYESTLSIDEELLPDGGGVRLKSWRLGKYRMRQTMSPKLRKQVLERGDCAECGSVTNLVVDHIWPWAMGGTDHILNLRCLCKKCNSKKSMNLIPRK